jgi:hypothetical protein
VALSLVGPLARRVDDAPGDRGGVRVAAVDRFVIRLEVVGVLDTRELPAAALSAQARQMATWTSSHSAAGSRPPGSDHSLKPRLAEAATLELSPHSTTARLPGSG